MCSARLLRVSGKLGKCSLDNSTLKYVVAYVAVIIEQLEVLYEESQELLMRA